MTRFGPSRVVVSGNHRVCAASPPPTFSHVLVLSALHRFPLHDASRARGRKRHLEDQFEEEAVSSVHSRAKPPSPSRPLLGVLLTFLDDPASLRREDHGQRTLWSSSPKVRAARKFPPEGVSPLQGPCSRALDSIPSV